jgi:digeranylgeranylglycerophospholipid reductase
MIGGKIAGRIAAEAIKSNRLDYIEHYEREWDNRLGKRHRIFDRIKDGIFDFSDDKFNSIAKAFNRVPMEKRTLGNLFKTALVNNPSLLFEVAKVFLIK